MNKVSFFLKEPKSNKDTAIYLTFRAKDGLMKYYPGVSIHPDCWDPKTQTCTKKGPRAVMNRVVAAMEQLDTDSRVLGRQLTRAAVIEHLDKTLNKSGTRATETVFPAFDWAVGQMYSGRILTSENKPYSPGTVKTIANARDALKSFNPALRFGEVDLAAYKSFIIYCNEQGHTLNYTGTLIKNWKALMRATEGKYHQNTIYKSEEFKQLSEDVYDIYLDETAKRKIYTADLSGRPRWETARDWFILGCYLGLRVNDLLSLKDINRNSKFITMVNEKTDERVVIPIHPTAKEIITKYNGFPPVITDVELNRVIKDIAKHLKMNTPVIYSVTRGGKRQDVYLEFWEMISSHTMRRSAITNLLAAGVPESIVMKLVGIKSHGTLKKYNKLGADEAAKIAAGLDYFKG